MFFQDWQVLERLDSVKLSYLGSGDYPYIIPHNVTLAASAAIAAGATLNRQVTMPSDAHFLWFATSMFYPDAPANPSAKDQRYRLMIRFVNGQSVQGMGNARKLEAARSPRNGWSPVENIVGRLRDPFYWPFPVFFRKGDFLQVEIFNPTAAAWTFPALVFIGYKVLRYPYAG